MKNSIAIRTVFRLYIYNKLPDITKKFPCHISFVAATFDCITLMPAWLPCHLFLHLSHVCTCFFFSSSSSEL